jgi:hypothetical protein
MLQLVCNVNDELFTIQGVSQTQEVLKFSVIQSLHTLTQFLQANSASVDFMKLLNKSILQLLNIVMVKPDKFTEEIDPVQK